MLSMEKALQTGEPLDRAFRTYQPHLDLTYLVENTTKIICSLFGSLVFFWISYSWKICEWFPLHRVLLRPFNLTSITSRHRFKVRV